MRHLARSWVSGTLRPQEGKSLTYPRAGSRSGSQKDGEWLGRSRLKTENHDQRFTETTILMELSELQLFGEILTSRATWGPRLVLKLKEGDGRKESKTSLSKRNMIWQSSVLARSCKRKIVRTECTPGSFMMLGVTFS